MITSGGNIFRIHLPTFWAEVSRLQGEKIPAIVSVLPEICLRGVHDEIHNVKKPLKPSLLKYFKWLRMLSHQRQRAGKEHILFSNQYTNDTLEAQKA